MIRRALAFARRWWPAVYLALIAWGIAVTPWTRSVGDLRYGLISGWTATAGWFVSWRIEKRRRQRAQRLLGDRSCSVCRHYSCNGAMCRTCGGECAEPRPATRPAEHSYWLN